ncbi:MAG: hypothetical protein GY950_08545, partial [bacterium]|nr:hypothetical protein [bacterium]
MFKLKKKPALLVMPAVLLPGLIISLLGIYFVSQQKRARELNTLKELNSRMTHIRSRIETETLNAIETAFKTASEAGVNFTNPNAVINGTKIILLGNPIVKYPFFINSGGNYLFPFSKKTVFPEVTPPYRPVDGGRKNDYVKAENLEFKKRKFAAAIELYLKYRPV